MKMRRAIALAAVTAAALSTVPTSSAMVPDSVQLSKLAFAAWSSAPDEDGRFTEIGAFGFSIRYHDSTTEELYGGFSRARCTRTKRPRMTIVSCRVFAGVGGPIAGDDFEMDPALRSARLSITEKGTTHEATWSAEGDPGISRYWEMCYTVGEEEEAGEGHGAGVFQPSRAEGRALGRKLAGRRHFAALITEVTVTECRFMSQRSLDALRSGQWDEVRYTYALPR